MPSRRRFIQGTTASAAVTLSGLDLVGCFKSASKKGVDPERWSMSVCPYCGVGCGLEVGSRGDQVVAIRGMKDHPVNRGSLCLLGKNLVEVLDTPDRLRRPMKRGPNGFAPMPWAEATNTVASRIREIIDRDGPDAFAMYVSASEYIEEYYVYNKFVKGCLGTNNLESSARLCWASGVVGLVKAFGADAPPCAYDDVDETDLLFIAGYNPSSSKPILFKRIMEARDRRTIPMIVVDPRRTDTATQADLHLQIRPGTDVALHNALAHVLIRDGLIDEDEARGLTENYDELAEHVAGATPVAAEEITGIPAADIERAAAMIGKAPRALFTWGQGLNQSRIGTRKVTSLLNLVFITGNLGKPGAGPLAVTGQTSAMGLREVGALPHLLPGFRLVTDAEAREEVADLWGVPAAGMSANKGKPIPAILEGVERGEIKALWIIHSNPAATFPDTNWVRQVLDKVEFLVVQDSYHPTETTRHAHVLLPGAQWAEKAGTMTNSERGLNLVEQAVPPPGEARSDLQIVMDVAREMGFGAQFPFENEEAIFEEYKRCTRGRPCDIGGVTYTRLRTDRGIQWPVPTAEHTGTKRRFLDRKFPRGKLRLNLHDHAEPAEPTDGEFPLALITGLVGMQFHSGTRTAKVEALRKAMPEVFVEIHPADASRNGIQNGALVTVESRRGRVKARARVTDTIREGSVFLPYHFGALTGADSAVNALTVRAFDELAKQPEYKFAAVRLRVV